MPIWAQAGLWGLAGSSALVIGAVLAFVVNCPSGPLPISWLLAAVC